MTSQPQIRIIIPVHGPEAHIHECLKAVLHSQTETSFEIFIVDDGFSGPIDQLKIDSNMYIIHSDGRGDAAKARNKGAENFGGKILVFIDSDVIVEPEAIKKLIFPIQKGRAEATVGCYSDNSQNVNFWQMYKQIYIKKMYSRKNVSVKNEFWSALSAIGKETFVRSGGFPSLLGGALGEDTALGMKLTTMGACILSVPDACGTHRKKYSFTTLVANDFKKGLNSFCILSTKPSALKDFRHSSPKNMAAVGTSGIITLFLPLFIFHPQSLLLISGLVISTILYLYSRIELIMEFTKKSVFFLFRAMPIMFLLDLVRVATVFTGTIISGKKSFSPVYKNLKSNF
jgi:glycosyltransferase involved in cell wall biosynthesis